ncbi:MAG TPA: metal-dependent hydrolase [Mycobacterium sp.]|nr:metal-dependent hydrolase [Mycobacterium sp.]
MSTAAAKAKRPAGAGKAAVKAKRGPLSHTEERVEIKPRNVRFDLSNTPLHWIPGEPIASHAISTFNYMLPVGERWFCQVYERLLPFVKDETLRRQMLGFMGQEGIHAKTHDDVLRNFLAMHGITTAERFADLVEWVEDRFYPLLDQLSDEALVQVLRSQLALIAVIEQLTAFQGTWLINCDLDQRGADPVMLDLFRWHGAEEVEHRFVAHDVAEYFEVNRWLHVALTAFVGVTYMPISLVVSKYLIDADRSLPKMGLLRILWEARAAGKRGVLPDWLAIVKEIPLIARKGYSPELAGRTAQAVAYLAQSPAVRAVKS